MICTEMSCAGLSCAEFGCAELSCTELRYNLPIDVMFGFRASFRLSLVFYDRGLHTCLAVTRNPCISWAFLFSFWLWVATCLVDS